MSDSVVLPKRLKRAESFLGIHFDFHAGDDCTEVGKTVTPEMVERIIEQVQPDYIQCDCKGHRGYSSYPTKVGYPAPGFTKDPLRIWRDVTAKHGVALFMHYSGVWDTEALKHHTEWERITEEGERDKNNTSTFGPYVDELLLPQMKELSDVYGVDGVWVDGECWATCQDYSEHVIAQFQRETGITEVPRKPEDPYFFEFTEFCREGFRKYLRYYVDEMHRHNPDFQIASNWAYTSFMLEPVTIDVDFLSGDYPLQDSVNSARLEGRCLVHQGKPWDLMAWAFSGKWESLDKYTTKAVVQLQQEAAVVLALGGGFQAYFRQQRDGSIYDWTMKLMAETAQFCRARQPFCHGATTVPQIAVLNSTTAFYRMNTRLFSPWDGQLTPVSGTLNCLLDAQHHVDVVSEHQVTGRMSEYPVIIIPEWGYLDPAFRAELLAYAEQGGNLVVIGPKAVALFEQELDVTLKDEPTDGPRWLNQNDWLGVTGGLWQAAELGKTAQPFGTMHDKDCLDAETTPAAAITPYGKGHIAGVFANIGSYYRKNRVALLRQFLNALVRELFPAPMVEVRGSHYVDVVLTRNHGKLMVNLVNLAGPHHDTNVITYDEVPPLGPLEVTLRLPAQPSKITLQPDGQELPVCYQNGIATVTVPRLDIHSILVVE